MKNNLLILISLLISSSGFSQKKQTTQLVKHILTPFNGMHSGFRMNGTTTTFFALVKSMKNIDNFASQNNSSIPPYKFGYYQIIYTKDSTKNTIQLKYLLPPNKDYKVKLFVKTNVKGSKFHFNDGQNNQSLDAKMGIDTLIATFKGKSTGVYDLNITPTYQAENTFLLSKIQIEEIE
jgi:hypothetical protein